MINKYWLLLTCLALITSCSGDKTFNDYARAGDTVAVAGGWQQNFNLDNISIDIKQGPQLIDTIPQGDTSIRASINLYADPLSSLIVSRETGIEFTQFAGTYENSITANFTGGDKDWYNTTVFVDLPLTLATGTYRIIVKNTQGDTFESAVEIIPGTGSPSTFTAANGTDLTPLMIAGMSRLPHYTIDFAGATIPHALELTLTHDPDSTTSGTGKAFAVNPTGFKKNLAWTDDGTQMKVILTPSSNTTPDNIIDYKFYVTGGISNLSVNSVAAYDINGNSIAGITATPTFNN